MLKERYPEVVVELAIEDYLTDIVTTGFDAGIRPGERLAKDMISVRLEPDQHFLLVGSPDYFESRPRPKKPDDLRGHACVIYRNVSSKRYFRWKFSKGTRTVHVDMEPSVIINDASLLVQGALNGLGLAYVLERQVRQHIASGALISVLDDWSVPTAGDFIYFPSDRQMSPALKVVVDALRYRDD
jgi:DNA-binding transcriptional LysR family regulator